MVCDRPTNVTDMITEAELHYARCLIGLPRPKNVIVMVIEVEFVV